MKMILYLAGIFFFSAKENKEREEKKRKEGSRRGRMRNEIIYRYLRSLMMVMMKIKITTIKKSLEILKKKKGL